jgi:hypothetical protein
MNEKDILDRSVAQASNKYDGEQVFDTETGNVAYSHTE